MTTLPDEIVTRIVHGRYIVPIIDGADPDQRPDAVPAQGSFAFVSSLGHIPVFETTAGPVTMMNVPIIGVLDDDGYLCTPIPGTMDPMYRGVTLYTTDNPVLAVTDWTWNVVYKFDAYGATALSIPAHGFALPAGLPVDLTTLAKVPSSPGYGLPQAEAALLRAEQAAQDSAADAGLAVEAAERAASAAEATDDGVAGLLGDPLTVTGGLLDEKLAVKADTATVYETFLVKADLESGRLPDAQLPTSVGLSLSQLGTDKADKTTVTTSLASKADLLDGKLPDAQLPASVATNFALLDEGKASVAALNLKADAATLETKADAEALSAVTPERGVRAVGKGELVVNVKDYGAKGDGVTDDTAALNGANDSATTFGARLFVPPGKYKTTDTVRFTTDTQVSAKAVIEYYGAGIALVMGDPAKVIFNLDMQSPVVEYKTSPTWDTTSVGVELVNLNTCAVLLRNARGFHTGFTFIGRGGGFAYNTITLGYSNQNRVAHHLTQDETGWCNQNTFIGGRVQLVADARGASADDPGAHYFLLEQGSTSISGPNNNTFIGCTLEGTGQAYYRIKFSGARYNTFINCRYENYGSTYRVGYFNASSSNRIEGGYDAWKIVEEFDPSSSGGTISDGTGGFYRQVNTSGQSIPNGTNTVLIGWPTSSMARITYDAAGSFTPRAGTWRIAARAMFAANPTGVRKLILSCGGSIQDIDEKPAAATTEPLRVYATYKFNGTQSFKVEAYQNSGAALGLVASSPYVKIEAEYLGY